MIGRLVGELVESQPPLMLLDVGGVGYEVFAPMSTFYQLSELTGKVTLYTHLVVREDAQTLFGFASKREKSLFQILIKANGVGPKLALAIMSGIDTDEFVSCIHAGDSAALVRIPGIGKKTAERLVIDLGDRLKDWRYGFDPADASSIESSDKSRSSSASNESREGNSERVVESVSGGSVGMSGNSAQSRYQLRKDAESALIALGYKAQDATKAVDFAVSELTQAENGSVNVQQPSREEVIRIALRSMVNRSQSGRASKSSRTKTVSV